MDNGVKVGTGLKSCDPRFPRKGTVTAMGSGRAGSTTEDGFVRVKWDESGLTTVVRLDRVHDKAIRSGYNIVNPPAPAEG